MLSKTYFKDKIVLFFILLSFFLVLANIALILFRVNFSEARLIARYLPAEASEQFQISDINYIYVFMVVAIISAIAGWMMSYKIYELYAWGAYLSLVFANIILVANLITVEALLRI